MTKQLPILQEIFLLGFALGLASLAPVFAQVEGNEFEVAEIYFELNNTDGDLGIHGFIDGGPWKNVRILDSHRRLLMNVRAWRNLNQQGVTELFFESAEPTFDELAPADFFARFPEGDYTVFGWTLERRLTSTTLIRHVMPAPPDGITVSGLPKAPTCDEENPNYNEALVPTVFPDHEVVIDWQPVTTSHPSIGKAGEIEVALYQFVVELETMVNGEVFESKVVFDLPPDVTSVKVPDEIIALSDEFKYEILVKENAGGNQTAEESCFFVIR